MRPTAPLRRIARCALALAAVLLAACSPRPLPHSVYVWQRVWTPELNHEIRTLKPEVAVLKVLMLELSSKQQWRVMQPDAATLDGIQQPLWLVVRISGLKPNWQVHTLATHLSAQLQRRQWAGVEIDFDCARSQLGAYALQLRELRKLLPHVQFAITSLPDWLQAPEQLKGLLSIVQSSVLQVHAVDQPKLGLFDRERAALAIARYAELSAQPFDVALPAYGVAARLDQNGTALAWAAEGASDTGAMTELQADPLEVAKLITQIERHAPSKLRGWSWFRLPLPSDRRAWSPRTFTAVLKREPLHARFSVRQDGPDIRVSNDGNLDARLPAISARGESCSGDALNGYSLTRDKAHWRFDPPAKLLNVGRPLLIGWLRCSQLPFIQTVP